MFTLAETEHVPTSSMFDKWMDSSRQASRAVLFPFVCLMFFLFFMYDLFCCLSSIFVWSFIWSSVITITPVISIPCTRTKKKLYIG